MHLYILRRLLLAIPTLLGVTILIFAAMRVLPGDPFATIEGESIGTIQLTPEQIAKARASLGLDRPYHVQYLAWIGDVLRGNLGTSFWRGEPLSELILRRAPITVQIAIMAILFSWIIGLPVGMLSATRRNSALDYFSRIFVTVFQAIPSFFLGMLVILVGILYFSWRPSLTIVYPWTDPYRNLEMTLGPALALGGLIGGSVAVERAFGVPGLGLALVMAVTERDWMLIQNLALFYGVVFVLVNLAVDVSYAWIDPRIRYG
jgi:peptide/nickel transport system permease protein